MLAYNDDADGAADRCSVLTETLPAGAHYHVVQENGRDAAIDAYAFTVVAWPVVGLFDRCDPTGTQSVCAMGVCEDRDGNGDGECLL